MALAQLQAVVISDTGWLLAQELSQWRQQQLQESLRNSVLDEEAAAKFSTAAALAAKEKRNQMAKANYDKGLLTAVDNIDAFTEVTALTHRCDLHRDSLFLTHAFEPLSVHRIDLAYLLLINVRPLF